MKFDTVSNSQKHHNSEHFLVRITVQKMASHLPRSVTASDAAGQSRLNSNEALSTLTASAMPHKLSSTNRTDCFTDSLLCTVCRSCRSMTFLNLLCTDCITYKTEFLKDNLLVLLSNNAFLHTTNCSKYINTSA